MKKMISLFVALMLCLSLCACANGTNGSNMQSEAQNANGNEVALTLDNYDQYIKVTPTVFLSKDKTVNNLRHFYGTSSYGVPMYTDEYSENIYGSVKIEGLSQNFNYKDITVEVELSGYCWIGDLSANVFYRSDRIEYRFRAQCDKVDIAGFGENSTGKFVLPAGYGIPVYDENLSNCTYNDNFEDIEEFKWDVVSVSGTVTPA